jgi:hypothetical protein
VPDVEAVTAYLQPLLARLQAAIEADVATVADLFTDEATDTAHATVAITEETPTPLRRLCLPAAALEVTLHTRAQRPGSAESLSQEAVASTAGSGASLFPINLHMNAVTLTTAGADLATEGPVTTPQLTEAVLAQYIADAVENVPTLASVLIKGLGDTLWRKLF